MDYVRVIEAVADFLEERESPYAIIGGIAVAAYGLMRATLDVDFLVDRAVQAELVPFLDRLGYETLHKTEGFSNHLHRDPDLGRVDFVYVTGATSQRLFTELRWLPGPGGRMLPVPRPEHLAALKVAAMKNDPGRSFQEMADIRFLLTLPDIDRLAVRDQFEKRGLLERFLEIEETL